MSPPFPRWAPSPQARRTRRWILREWRARASCPRSIATLVPVQEHGLWTDDLRLVTGLAPEHLRELRRHRVARAVLEREVEERLDAIGRILVAVVDAVRLEHAALDLGIDLTGLDLDLAGRRVGRVLGRDRPGALATRRAARARDRA